MSGGRLSGLKLLARKSRGLKRGTGEPVKVMNNKASSSSTPYTSPKPPFLYRARGIYGALLGVNLLVAGYMFFRAPPRRHHKDKEGGENKEAKEEASRTAANLQDHRQQQQSKDHDDQPLPLESEDGVNVHNVPSTDSDTATLAEEATIVAPPVAEGEAQIPIHRPPESKNVVSAEQWREILQWILAEKRKEKPASLHEKRKIDEEKRLLKDFIRAKSPFSIP